MWVGADLRTKDRVFLTSIFLPSFIINTGYISHFTLLPWLYVPKVESISYNEKILNKMSYVTNKNKNNIKEHIWTKIHHYTAVL